MLYRIETERALFRCADMAAAVRLVRDVILAAQVDVEEVNAGVFDLRERGQRVNFVFVRS